MGLAAYLPAFLRFNTPAEAVADEAAKPPPQSPRDQKKANEKDKTKTKAKAPRNQETLINAFAAPAAPAANGKPVAGAGAATSATPVSDAVDQAKALGEKVMANKKKVKALDAQLSSENKALYSMEMKLIQEAGKQREDPEFANVLNPVDFSMHDPRRWEVEMVFNQRLRDAHAMLTDPLPENLSNLKKLYTQRDERNNKYFSDFQSYEHLDPKFYVVAKTQMAAINTLHDLMRVDQSKAHAMVEKFAVEFSKLDAKDSSDKQVGPQAAGTFITHMDAISHLVEANKAAFVPQVAGSESSSALETVQTAREEWAKLEENDRTADTEDVPATIRRYQALQLQLKEVSDLARAVRLQDQKQADPKDNEPVRTAA